MFISWICELAIKLTAAGTTLFGSDSHLPGSRLIIHATEAQLGFRYRTKRGSNVTSSPYHAQGR